MPNGMDSRLIVSSLQLAMVLEYLCFTSKYIWLVQIIVNKSCKLSSLHSTNDQNSPPGMKPGAAKEQWSISFSEHLTRETL